MFQSLYSGSNKVPVSTMGAIIWNKKEHNFTINQPWPVAPHKISDREVKILRRVVQVLRTKTTKGAGIIRCNGFKENNKRCTPWPVCTLAMQDSIAKEKVCWALKVCWITIDACEILGEYSLRPKLNSGSHYTHHVWRSKGTAYHLNIPY